MLILSSLITLLVYYLCLTLLPKSPLRHVNPILITIGLIIAILLIGNIDYKTYQESTGWITHLLGPIVVMLALPLYHNRQALKNDIVPIMGGILSSIITSTLLVFTLGKLLGLGLDIQIALLPKSITTPMAIEVTKMFDGVQGLTIVFVILTGIIGASIAPYVMKLTKVSSNVAKGIGIGAASHGIGTSKAIEMDEEIGASSGLAMGLAGVVTVIVASIVSAFM